MFSKILQFQFWFLANHILLIGDLSENLDLSIYKNSDPGFFFLFSGVRIHGAFIVWSYSLVSDIPEGLNCYTRIRIFIKDGHVSFFCSEGCQYMYMEMEIWNMNCIETKLAFVIHMFCLVYE